MVYVPTLLLNISPIRKRGGMNMNYAGIECPTEISILLDQEK